MSTITTILIMCLIGYIGFAFVAESLNPVRKRRHLHGLKSRHRRGVWVGAFVAVSSIIAFFVPGGILPKLKASFLVSAILLTLLAIFFAISFFLDKRKRSGSQKGKKRSKADKATSQADVVTAKNQKVEDKAGVTTPAVATHAAQLHAQTDDSAELNNTDKTKLETGSDASDVTSTVNEAVHPLEDVSIQDAPAHANQVLVDQSNHADFSEPDLGTGYVATSKIQDRDHFAANHGQFQSSHHVDQDEIVVDDFFDSTAEVDTTGVEEVPVASAPSPVTPSAEDVQDTPVYNTETRETTGSAFAQNPTHTSDQADNTVEPEFVPEPPTPETLEIEALAEQAPDIDQLAYAMNTVSVDAERIQESVLMINQLHEREQYYRTELNGARLAYEKAQEAQNEATVRELKQGSMQLQQEKIQRERLELNLDSKRDALDRADLRVRELETELSERQKVFYDQLESLQKTKEMARNAAQLARKAAIAQQRARTTALKERAARERLEVSAKRAVDIARNAISKLAEEERKNSSPNGNGLH